MSRYRDNIDPANTWVVSDTHFGHDNIVDFCFRPLDHEQVMIAQWRKAVPDDATVLHLGDLSYSGNARFKHILAPELTGAKKYLILGNHDRQRFSFYRDSGFQVIKPFHFDYGDPALGKTFSVSFSHYPWSEKEEGRTMNPWEVRVHGHIHNNGYTRDEVVPFLRNHINVSVEQTKYMPLNLKLLLDAALFGEFPETTQEQLDEARARKEAAQDG